MYIIIYLFLKEEMFIIIFEGYNVGIVFKDTCIILSVEFTMMDPLY